MVSSKDVAKFANVSQTTVSRVLNTPELVKPKTFEKVMNAIKELNYHPDPVARSLVSKQTKTIALISGPLHNPFFVEATSAIVDYANEKDYKVNVHFTNDDRQEITYRNLFENKVDGIIMSAILYEDPLFEELKNLNIPIVFFNRKHKDVCNFVEIDNHAAGYKMGEHLLHKGYKNIFYMSGNLDKSTFLNRYEGFIAAMKDHQMDLPEENVIFSNTDPASLEKIFYELISSEVEVDAFAASTDSIALTLLDCCLKENFKVPEEIAIMGIDNVSHVQKGYSQISSIGGSDGFDLGKIAIEKLFDLIENRINTVQITEPVSLYERKTT